MIIALVMVAAVGMSLTACGSSSGTANNSEGTVTATWIAIPQTKNYELDVTAITIEGEQTMSFTLSPVETPEPCEFLLDFTYVFLFCGKGLTCGVGLSLSPYYKWATDNNYEIQSINYDSCSPKTNCASEAEQEIGQIKNENSEANFIFIGHSGGADVAVLTASAIIGTTLIN